LRSSKATFPLGDQPIGASYPVIELGLTDPNIVPPLNHLVDERGIKVVIDRISFHRPPVII
jgi:hypothetical protein